MIKHQDGHADKPHYGDFIAARTQQGLNSLNSSFGSNFRTKALERVAECCKQGTSKFSRMKVISVMELTGGCQNPDDRENASGNLYLPVTGCHRRLA